MTPRTVLFLGTKNLTRAKHAETYFNNVAKFMNLPWVAMSRGLATEKGAAAEADLSAAAWLVALNEPEHRPMLEQQFPAWFPKVEFWHVASSANAPKEIEIEVTDLVSRLMRGGIPRVAGPRAPEPVEQKSTPAKKLGTAKVSRETAGRRGKGVTVISELQLDDAELKELATKLKNLCGTGGTAKDGRIEIQGDQRDRICEELQKMGYKVKRAGG